MADVLVENSTSPQVKLLYEGREAFKARDINRLEKYFHKDFRRIFHPRCLGRQPLSKDEDLEQIKGLFALPGVQFDVRYAVRRSIFYQAKSSCRRSTFPS
jgi:hypothetical protein